ncbi:MAG: PilZ domain-containing protein [Candidatus Aminicenantes bacterium]|nr:PilZ domain-containing protein [Candidatus Aminicenantes bacterium]
MAERDRRQFSRIRKRIMLRVNNRPGILLDLSSTGMRVSTSMVPASRSVRIQFQADGTEFDLDGHILWINKRYALQNLKEMGIFIQNRPESYKHYLQKVTGVAASCEKEPQ